MAGRPLSMQGRLIFAKAGAFYSYMTAVNQLLGLTPSNSASSAAGL
jgi:hypothetical protein